MCAFMNVCVKWMEGGASGLIGQNVPLVAALVDRHGQERVTIRNQLMEAVPVRVKAPKHKCATR